MKKIKIIITLFIIVFMLDCCDNNKKIRIDQAEKENGIETEVSEKGRITAGAYYVAALDEKKKYILHGRQIIHFMLKQKIRIGVILTDYLRMRNFHWQYRKMKR